MQSLNVLCPCSYVFHWSKGGKKPAVYLEVGKKKIRFCVRASSLTKTALLFLVPTSARPGLELRVSLMEWKNMTASVYYQHCWFFFNHVNPYFAFAFAYSLKELTGAFMVLSVFPEDNLKCVYVDAGSWNLTH